MLKSTNLNLNERMKIITADMQIKSLGKKVTYTELSKQAYFDKRTSNLCQNRKYSTLKTGILCDRKKRHIRLFNSSKESLTMQSLFAHMSRIIPRI